MTKRPARLHIFMIDGTFSRLEPGRETNIGRIYRLLEEVGPSANQSFGYHPGVQGEGWSKLWAGITGFGLNDAIMDTYATLASRYEPGDRVILLGYSRGAYGVRSLAGWIARVGLLKSRHALPRRVARAFRYYEAGVSQTAAAEFKARFCHENVPIELIGCFDTVKALGLPYPVLNRLAPFATEFHDHTLSQSVANAAHALALDESRITYAPVPWNPAPDWPGTLEQAWFAGAHPDIGGQLGGMERARALSNIPLVWMLQRLERCGVTLPEGWAEGLKTDPGAPMVGSWRGINRLYLMRATRIVRRFASEALHPSVLARTRLLPRYKPKAEISGATGAIQPPPQTLTEPLSPPRR
ncbi:MAG: DUF2235 domain-containing protein [Pseudomonadota bacterium]